MEYAEASVGSQAYQMSCDHVSPSWGPATQFPDSVGNDFDQVQVHLKQYVVSYTTHLGHKTQPSPTIAFMAFLR